MTTTPKPHNPKRRSRTRKSAKNAGARFEREIADYLAQHVDDRIDRRVRTGAKDTGDIGGVRVHGQRIVVECKNTSRVNLAGWAAEAEVERVNDGALAGIVVHKRHGRGDPADQWVTLTVLDLIALLTGTRPADAPAARLVGRESDENPPRVTE